MFSREDGARVGLCTEFPGLSHLAATRVEAMQGTATLVAAVVDDMIGSGENLPEAMSDHSDSGNSSRAFLSSFIGPWPSRRLRPESA